ncbi:GntR family transcriptional regulator [Micromonospora tulbaghiae]|uniref:GntR family transcriptional regulator n=1 Tax=Micromonospora tulbaghiae TaxID=479978 RepID=UPI00332A5D5E
MTTITPAPTVTDQIFEDLRRKIVTGELTPGTRLPTQDAMAAEWKVHRTTARNAYGKLIVAGLIESRGPAGHFVRSVKSWARIPFYLSDPENNISTDDGPQDAWAHRVRKMGRDPSEVITPQVIYPEEVHDEYLRLGGARVPLLARRRFRHVDGWPSARADSFYRLDHVSNTPVALPGQVVPGVYQIFADMGLPWVRTVDEITSRPPHRDEARELRITGSTTLIEVVRVSYTRLDGGEDLPVRMTMFLLPADRYTAVYEHQGEAPQ